MSMVDFEAASVNAIFLHHGIAEPWAPLAATGIANRIYATSSVVLRIATDHPEALGDARTESVAAPVVHAAGIRTPALIAYDDSRQIVDRPYTLWERVHGQAVGQYALDANAVLGTWADIGRELARLHCQFRTARTPGAGSSRSTTSIHGISWALPPRNPGSSIWPTRADSSAGSSGWNPLLGLSCRIGSSMVTCTT